MEDWNNDEWPMPIRRKDDGQKRLHKAVTAVFLLIMDGDEQALSLDAIHDICRSMDAQDHLQGGDASGSFDEDYGQILDIIEGLKIGLDRDRAIAAEGARLVTELTETFATHDDDIDFPVEPDGTAKHQTVLTRIGDAAETFPQS